MDLYYTFIKTGEFGLRPHTQERIKIGIEGFTLNPYHSTVSNQNTLSKGKAVLQLLRHRTVHRAFCHSVSLLSTLYSPIDTLRHYGVKL